MFKNLCTIVMYHYVRNIYGSQYPNLKGLEIGEFREQLNFFLDNYSIIRMEDLIECAVYNKKLPEKAMLLTFDDGYVDHYNNVYPELKKVGVQGSFYPSARTALNNEVLDVNKIHFILDKVDDKSKLIKEIFELIDNVRSEYSLLSNDEYYNKLSISNRFDDKDTIFIKRLLQKELPFEIRKNICNMLFKQHMEIDEYEFSKNLYMNIQQLRDMKKNGMHIGSHGYNHLWLDTLPELEQQIEIKKSLEFLEEIHEDLSNWTMCFPYGSYNNETIDILKRLGCKLAFTTKVDFFTENSNCFEIPRFDTNDFYPKIALQSN